MKKPFQPHPDITKQVVQQYEKIRKSNKVNMYASKDVALVANEQGSLELFVLIAEEVIEDTPYLERKYTHLLKNFDLYIEHFNIK
jgi:hypothetical protein